jgi:hypothetical protein
MFIMVLPTLASSQPVPHRYPVTVIERCYNVLFPYPYSRCEYIHIRRDYTPIPHHRHYIPVPQRRHLPPPPNRRPSPPRR